MKLLFLEYISPRFEKQTHGTRTNVFFDRIKNRTTVYLLSGTRWIKILLFNQSFRWTKTWIVNPKISWNTLRSICSIYYCDLRRAFHAKRFNYRLSEKLGNKIIRCFTKDSLESWQTLKEERGNYFTRIMSRKTVKIILEILMESCTGDWA